MLITLDMKRECYRAERSLSGTAWGCSTDTKLGADKILECSSSPSSSVTNVSLFSRTAFSDQTQGAHTQADLLLQSAYLLWHKHFSVQLKHFKIFQINTEDWECSSRETTVPTAWDCGLGMTHSLFLETKFKDTKDNLLGKKKSKKR